MSAGRQDPCLFLRNARGFLVSELLFTLLLACACSYPHAPKQPSAPGEYPSSTAICIDEIGRQVRLPKRPQRIISLSPGATEILYLIGADDRLIGDTTYCDWPENAKQKPKIGDLLNPNSELILAARPDLIIASTAGNDRTAVLKLASLGLPVYVSAPRSVQMIFDTILNIGRITDRAEAATALVDQLKSRLQAVANRTVGLPPTRVFYMTWFDPLLAPGKNTFENDVLRRANAVSVTADIDEFYPRYSLEQLLAQDPDAILAVRYPGSSLPDLSQIAGWRHLRAVQQGKVYVLSDLLQHPSPRFVDGIEELARKLYPERF